MHHETFVPVTTRLRQLLGPGGLGELDLELDPSPPTHEPDALPDMLFRAKGPDGSLRFALLVAVLELRDESKPRAWALANVLAHRRLRCPVFVLVISLDQGVARWADRTFDLGATTLRPLVVGPRDIPIVTDPARAAGICELALVSGIAHAKSRHAEAIGTALHQLLADEPPERARQYWDLFLDAIDEDLRESLQERLGPPRPRAAAPSST